MIKLLHLMSMMGFVALFLILSFVWQGSLVLSDSSRLVAFKKQKAATVALLGLLVLSVAFGALLVHQKGYFFTTPWIRAALLMSFVLFCMLSAIAYLQRRNIAQGSLSLADKFRLRALQLLSFLVIVVIAHDAVTKMTTVLS